MSDLKTEDGPAEVQGRKKCEHCQQYGHAGDWAALEEYTGNTADLLRKVCEGADKMKLWDDYGDWVVDYVPGLREWWEANKDVV